MELKAYPIGTNPRFIHVYAVDEYGHDTRDPSTFDDVLGGKEPPETYKSGNIEVTPYSRTFVAFSGPDYRIEDENGNKIDGVSDFEIKIGVDDIVTTAVMKRTMSGFEFKGFAIEEIPEKAYMYSLGDGEPNLLVTFKKQEDGSYHALIEKVDPKEILNMRIEANENS